MKVDICFFRSSHTDYDLFTGARSMPTSSFDKRFVVHDPADAERFRTTLSKTNPIKITPRDLKADSEKGIAALKKLRNKKGCD